MKSFVDEDIYNLKLMDLLDYITGNTYNTLESVILLRSAIRFLDAKITRDFTNKTNSANFQVMNK